MKSFIIKLAATVGLSILFLGIVSASKFKRNAVGLDWQDKSVISIKGEIGGRTALDFGKAVTEEMVKKVEDIYIVISSPGGDVVSGYVIAGIISNANEQGITTHCAVPFLAASMAMHTLAYCKKRYALPEALLLFHEISTSSSRVTPRTAEQSKEMMEILVKPLEENLINQLGTDEATYRKHNEMETMWPATMFETTFPLFGLNIVRYMKVPDYIKMFSFERDEP